MYNSIILYKINEIILLFRIEIIYMDVLDQIQKLIKQAAENNERIQKKYKWFLDKQQEIIEKIRGLDNKINNTKQYINDQKQKYNRQLEEYKEQGEKYKKESMEKATAWIDGQKKLLLDKLKDMIQRVLKAKTL